MRLNGIWLYASGLVFLGFAVAPESWETLASTSLLLRIASCLLIAVVYLGTSVAAEWSLSRRWLWIGLLVASVCLLVPQTGWRASYCVFYVAIAQATLLPLRQARIAISGTGVVVISGSVLLQDWLGMALGFGALVTAFAIAFGIQGRKDQEKLQALEKRNSILALAAERDRIGRDLHDILGHSLTAVAVKSQLAQRLIQKDPAAAVEQIAEVENIARQALTDVRATASGMREVSAASEMASAQSVLIAAGIEPDVPSAAPLLGPKLNELFGYAIREAVTNVVRHSEARSCRIELSETRVRIIDDGRGAQGKRGNGLVGLAERARGSGASMHVGAGADGLGTVIAVQSGPVTAVLEEAR